MAIALSPNRNPFEAASFPLAIIALGCFVAGWTLAAFIIGLISVFCAVAGND